MRRIPLLASALLILSCAPLHALAAAMVVTPVTVPDGEDARLSAISAGGELGGDYFNTNAFETLGFVLKGSKVTVLPAPTESHLYSAVVPTSITDKGVAAGVWYNHGAYTGMVFRKGVYVAAFEAGVYPGVANVKMNSKGLIIVNAPNGKRGYTYYTGNPFPAGYASAAGGDGVLRKLKLDKSSRLVSINASGDISGVYKSGQPMVFTLSGRQFTQYSAPGASATYGGFMNDDGDLAGSYQDANGLHGFIEHQGAYTTFDAPAPVSNLRVQGFSNTGYVAGVFTGADGQQSGFLYHSGKLFPIASYDSGSYVVTVVGVSDSGEVAFNVLSNSDNSITPYVAACAGADC